MAEILTTPQELKDALAAGAYPDGGPVRILDVRWRLDKPDGRDDYRAGHIPGAVYVDLDHELASHGEPQEGRHPLPAREEFEASARRWGIRRGDTVVVYDNLKNLSSARAWWLLRFFGVADVRLLDGSLRAWTSAGYGLATGDEAPSEGGDVVLTEGTLPTLDLDTVADFASTRLLLDARASERYRGDVEPIDPRAGHIPGAVNAPTTDNVDGDGRFLPEGALRARFTALGGAVGTPVGVYCGSGVTAAHEAVALSLAGFEPVLYPGSWSQWSNHPERAVATGAEPG